MNISAVKVPRELLQVRAIVLEEYVRNRLLQFIRGFGQRMAQLSPQLDPTLLDKAVRDTLETLPLPDYGQVPVEMLELQLVFRHDCLALGCTEPQCVLCQHNSQRRCTVNFNKKYLVNDRMVARCGAQIRIEVVDRATAKLYDGELPDVYLEMFVLDGTAHDQRFLGEAARLGGNGSEPGWPDSALDEVALLLNNKQQPLISSLTAGRTDEVGRLILQTLNGRLVLPDLFITDSSEALLSGRKPPFRLVVRARHRDGRRLAIRHAVSEPFVVATRRVRASHKVEIPSMDDPVSKLDHMGRETVKKLMDLRSAAHQAGVDLSGLEPELSRIEKVGEFKALALRAEGDGHLRQQLQALLKLAKEKWDEAAEHAKRAVVPDNRLRAWYADCSSQELGLLFPCRLGVVDLKRPEALLQRVMDAAGASKMEVVGQQQQNPIQRDLVRQLLPQAEANWWVPGHLGWTIFPIDTDSFEVNAATNAAYTLDLAMFGAASPSPATPLHNSAPLAATAAAPTAAVGAGNSLPLEPPAIFNSAPPPAVGPGSFSSSRQTNGHQLHMAPRDVGGGSNMLQPPQLLAPPGGTAAAAAAGGGPAAVASYPPMRMMAAPDVSAAAAAAAAAGNSGLGLDQLGNISSLQLLLEQSPSLAAAVAAQAGGMTGEQELGMASVEAAAAMLGQQQQQQQQQQRCVQAGSLPPLPAPEELQAMFVSGTLTPEAVTAMQAAIEAGQCPPELLVVIHNNQQQQQQRQQQQQQAAKAAAAAAAGYAGYNGNSSSSSGLTAAGVKRSYSAAAGSYNGGSQGGPAGAQCGAVAGGVQLEPVGGRPASFSGAIDTTTRRAAAAALAAVDDSIPEESAVDPAAAGALGDEGGGGAAAAAAAVDDDLLRGPFYEQLRRDSMKGRSRGAGGSSTGRNRMEAAAALAIAAVDADAAAAPTAAAAAAAGGAAPGGAVPVSAAAAAAAAATAAAAAVAGDSSEPLDQGSFDIRNLPHGLSLEIDGLRAAYPSILLDYLAAATDSDSAGAAVAAAAARGVPGMHVGGAAGPAATALGSNGTCSPSSAAAAAAAAADVIQLSPEMQQMAAAGPSLGEGLSAMQISLKDCPSLLPLPSGADFTFDKTGGLGSKGIMSCELGSLLLQGVSSGADGLASGGSEPIPAWGSTGARKPLHLADSGLANMESMNQALQEAVSGDLQHMQD